MTLKEALGIKAGEVVSLVGGGGKTTLMFRLAKELWEAGELAICTTTTKIWEPSKEEAGYLLLSPDEAELTDFTVKNLPLLGRMTLVTRRLPEGKLKGVTTTLIIKLGQLLPKSFIIVEADGSRQKSIKAPNATEPVIPENTSLVVAVVGIDGIGATLSEENVFRPDMVAQLTGLNLGEAITPEAVARLITHKDGLAKGMPQGARLIPFINKVDLDGGLKKSRSLARYILGTGHPTIDRVVLGSLASQNSVAEIIDIYL